MKRFCLFSFLLFATLALQAQRPYFCVTEGTVMEYANYGNDGETSGYTRITVKNVEGSDGNYAITYQTSIFDSDRQPLFDPADMTVSIDNGNVSASLGSVGIVEVSGDVPVIPSRLAVGQELDGGVVKLTTMGMSFTSEILSHKVTGREELKTPAGTFKCYIVEMTTEARVFGRKSTSTTRNWYARGLGSIKSETLDENGNITGSQILVKLED
jgi:hypothetical protein